MRFLSWRGVLEIVAALALVGCAVWGTSAYLVAPWEIEGPSMEPTLSDGDRVLVVLRAFRGGDPAPGEIVVVDGPDGIPIVKRVTTAPPAAEVPVGSVWIRGDNPIDSTDSRQFGAIPRQQVRGRVVLRFWPPGRLGRVR